MGANPAYAPAKSAARMVHGHHRGRKHSPEYNTWIGMRRRCQDIGSKDYANWGGRGISVCQRWDSSFANFLADMGPKPSHDHQIDRIDSSGDYEPGNCRWVTVEVQGAENKRSNIAVTVAGMDFDTITAGCRYFGLNKTTVGNRIKRGMSIEDAFTTPKGRIPSQRDRTSYLPKDHPDRG